MTTGLNKVPAFAPGPAFAQQSGKAMRSHCAGPFKVWNVPNEKALLHRWFQHMRESRCAVYVTYNGDFFDWPFLETRAAACSMDMKAELGFSCSKKGGECLSRYA